MRTIQLSNAKLSIVSTALLDLAGVFNALIGVICTGANVGALFGADPTGSANGVADGVPSKTLQVAVTYSPSRKLQVIDAVYI